MSGNSSTIKTVNKPKHFASHGTHSVDPGQLARMRREKLTPPRAEMFGSVKEAFSKKRRKSRLA